MGRLQQEQLQYVSTGKILCALEPWLSKVVPRSGVKLEAAQELCMAGLWGLAQSLERRNLQKFLLSWLADQGPRLGEKLSALPSPHFFQETGNTFSFPIFFFPNQILFEKIFEF